MQTGANGSALSAASKTAGSSVIGAAPLPVSSKTSVFLALDEAPMTAVRYVYWLLAGGGTFLDGFSVVSLGIAVPLLKRDLTMGPVVVGLIGSALVLGAVLGAALGGIAADRLGRKSSFIADMAILTAGSALCAFAPGPWIILAGQFVIGIGIGIDFPTSSSYVSEIMPRAVRSRMTIATIALQSVGMIAAALTAIAVFRAHPSLTDWRMLLGAGGLLALAFMAARLRLPESPRWLAEKGRLADAASVLSHLTSIPVSLARMEMAKTAAPPKQALPKTLGMSALFGPRYRVRTLLVSLPWLMMDVATYGVGLFTPVILGAMHFASAGGGTLAAVFADAKGSAIVDIFLLFGFLAGMWAVPRFGRIPMQIAGFAGMSLGMLLLIFATMASNSSGLHLGLVVAGFVIFNFAMNAGPNGTTFTLAPVLFPTTIRASASGFAAACAKIGATFGTFVVPQLQAAWGLIGVLALMAFVSIGGLVATAAFAHEVHEEDRMEETPDAQSSQGA
jgi:MFS transporter, putative metabolite transport protein